MNFIRQKRAWRWGLIGCAGVVLLLVTCGLLNCFIEQPPPRHFRIKELLIDESAFPPGWKINVVGPPGEAPLGGQTSIERISVDFHNQDGVALQQVHRYASAKAAAREFERVLSIEFPVGKHWSSWRPPEGFTYQSPYADQFRVGCAYERWDGSTTEFCRMVGQYEEYVVRFSTKISPVYMTYHDFEQVVRAIDEKMGRYLDTEHSQPSQ